MGHGSALHRVTIHFCSPVYSLKNVATNNWTWVAVSYFFEKHGSFDFACIYCSQDSDFKITLKNFRNSMETLVTLVSVILAVYIPI